MTNEQIKFKQVLDKHARENKCYFTSNDFHSIFNAINEYRQSDIDCIANFMGILNTPIGRKRNPGNFVEESVEIGRDIINRNIFHNSEMSYKQNNNENKRSDS